MNDIFLSGCILLYLTADAAPAKQINPVEQLMATVQLILAMGTVTPPVTDSRQ